jgi:hypothetical protein
MPCDDYYSIGLKLYMKLQKIEIDEHKWYLSQYCNREVPYNEAVQDFIQNGYANLFRRNFIENHASIETCMTSGELEKILESHDAKRLHELLGDE